MPKSKRSPPRSSPRLANAPAVCCGGEGVIVIPVTLRWPRRGPRRATARAVHPSRLASLAPQDDGIARAVVARRMALSLRRFRFAFWLDLGFRRGCGRFHAAEPTQHGVGGALARF